MNSIQNKNLDRSKPDDMKGVAVSDQPHAKDLTWADQFSDLLDTRFVIPGTNIRFGADFLLGLVPGVGDVISLGFSGVLIATLVNRGASTLLVLRMLINVLLDTIVGSIPILGNLFDLFYKANRRNLILMREHYDEGKHSGSAWPLVALIVGTLLLVAGGLIWSIVALIGLIWQS